MGRNRKETIMTKFLTGLIYLITSCAPVMAADRIVEGTSLPGISYEKNFVKNPEAEKNANNLTVSAAIATRTTTTPLQGAGSFSIDATASGQTVKFDTTTGDEYLKGQNCEAKFIFTGDASLYKVYVEQGSNKLTGDLQLTNETNARSVSLNFPCGTTFTNLRPVIESTSASAAAIKVDKVYLGLATNISDSLVDTPWVDESTSFVLQGSGTAGTPTYSTRKVWTRRNGPNLEVAFDLTLSGGGGAVGDIQMVLPSKYTMSSTGPAQLTLPQGWAEILRNGESFYGHANVIVRVGTSTVQFGTRRLDTGVSYTFTWVSGDILRGRLIVPIEQFSNAQAIKINQTPWFVSAVINGGSPSLGTADVTSDTEITNSGLTMTPNSGSSPVGIVCSSTNAAATPSTGSTTCSAGDEGLGAAFEIPYPGLYEVCTEFTSTVQVGPGANSLIYQTFKLTETATNAQTTISGSTHAIYARHYAVDATQHTISDKPNSLCETFNFGSSGVKAVRLKYQQDVNGTVTNSLVAANNGTGSGNFRISVKQLTVPYPMPILVNSVTSNTSGQERIERATITNSGTPTVSTQSGSWISSITDGGVGIATLNIAAGIFSGPPSCTVSQYGGGGTALCYVSTTVTSTAATIVCYNSSFALTDRDFMVMCMGPR